MASRNADAHTVADKDGIDQLDISEQRDRTIGDVNGAAIAAAVAGNSRVYQLRAFGPDVECAATAARAIVGHHVIAPRVSAEDGNPTAVFACRIGDDDIVIKSAAEHPELNPAPIASSVAAHQVVTDGGIGAKQIHPAAAGCLVLCEGISGDGDGAVAQGQPPTALLCAVSLEVVACDDTVLHKLQIQTPTVAIFSVVIVYQAVTDSNGCRDDIHPPTGIGPIVLAA